jgi:ribose transport system permease protein
MRTLKQIAPLLAAIVALEVLFRCGIPGLLDGVSIFWTRENQIDLLQQISINAILGFGMTLTILIGGIDLSVGAVMALAGTMTVYVLGAASGGLHERLAIAGVCAAGAVVLFEGVCQFGLPIKTPPHRVWAGRAVVLLGAIDAACFLQSADSGVARLAVAVWAGLGVATCFGLFNGVCAARTRMPPFIITLATMEIARGAALRFNGGQPIPIPRDHAFLQLGLGRLFGVIPIPVLVMGAIFLIAAVLLHRTRFGQHLYAMGGNREAARFTGIRLARNEIAVYTLCGVLAGVAGMIDASQNFSAVPSGGVGAELNAIAASVVGGTSFTGGVGTIGGTFLGAVIIGILNKGLNQAGIHFAFQHVVKGVVILVAVWFGVRKRGSAAFLRVLKRVVNLAAAWLRVQQRK